VGGVLKEVIRLDQLILTLISALINGIALMVGMWLGTRMTSDAIERKIKNILDKSPTAKRFARLMEQTDKLFGDEQAVEQVTRFFREATKLVTSPEARAFFVNATEILKELSGKQKVELKLPKKRRTD